MVARGLFLCAKPADQPSYCYGAAAGGEHDTVHSAEIVDHSRLALAKPFLTFFLKDEWDIDTRARLNLVVTVNKRQVQGTREIAPNRRLARAHGSDKKNVSRMLHKPQCFIKESQPEGWLFSSFGNCQLSKCSTLPQVCVE